MNEKIKKAAPLVGFVIVIILLALYARNRSSAAAGPALVSAPGQTMPDNSRAQIEATYNLGALDQKRQAYASLLDYKLGSQKIASDADVTKFQTSTSADVTRYLTDAELKATLDKQGRDFLSTQTALDLNYRLEQGRTNANKSIAKHNILGGVIGGGLKLLGAIF